LAAFAVCGDIFVVLEEKTETDCNQLSWSTRKRLSYLEEGGERGQWDAYRLPP